MNPIINCEYATKREGDRRFLVPMMHNPTQFEIALGIAKTGPFNLAIYGKTKKEARIRAMLDKE